MKRVVVVLCAVLLSLGWVSTAEAAAAAATRPSAPTVATVVVGKTAAEATLSWSAPASAGSSAVYGYSIDRTGGGASFSFWDKASSGVANAFSHPFVNLRPGSTYVFALRAWSAAGSSTAVRISYTTPVAPATSVYAANGSGHVFRIPAAGGAAVQVAAAADVTELTSDRRGGVYFANRAARTVSQVPAGGAAPVVVASGLIGPSALAVDDGGALYIADGAVVLKRSFDGATTTFYRASNDVSSIAVTPAGVLTVAVSGSDGFVSVATNGAATPRPVTCWQYGFCLTDYRVDSANTLYLPAASGGSGYIGWMRAAGSTTEATPVPSELRYYAAGLGPDDTFYLAQTRNFCSSPAENTGSCRPDRSVPAVSTFRADGTVRGSIPVSNVTLRARGSAVVVDTAGTLFVNAAQGIVSVPRAGGAAKVIAAGDFDQLVSAG